MKVVPRVCVLTHALRCISYCVSRLQKNVNDTSKDTEYVQYQAVLNQIPLTKILQFAAALLVCAKLLLVPSAAESSC